MKKHICCIFGFFILIFSMYADLDGFGWGCSGRDLVTLQSGIMMGGYGTGPVIEAEASYNVWDITDYLSLYGSYIFSYRFVKKNIPSSAILKNSSVIENIFGVGASYYYEIDWDFGIEASLSFDFGASENFRKVKYENFNEKMKESTAICGFSLGAEVFYNMVVGFFKFRASFGDFIDPYDKYVVNPREYVPKDKSEIGFILGAGITF